MPAQNDIGDAARPEGQHTEHAPIETTPAHLLGFAAALLAGVCAEDGPGAGLCRFTAALIATILDTRGIEDAARFAARCFDMEFVDGPEAATA